MEIYSGDFMISYELDFFLKFKTLQINIKIQFD